MAPEPLLPPYVPAGILPDSADNFFQGNRAHARQGVGVIFTKGESVDATCFFR